MIIFIPGNLGLYVIYLDTCPQSPSLPSTLFLSLFTKVLNEITCISMTIYSWRIFFLRNLARILDTKSHYSTRVLLFFLFTLKT